MTTEPETASCACCGQSRVDAELTGLACHPEIRICRDCIGWLAVASRNGLTSTPIFPTRDMDESVAFYRAAGFEVDMYDAGYAFVRRSGSEVLHLAGTDDLDLAANQAACYLNTSEADEWHRAWSDAGLAVSPIEDQPHGMREFDVRDPSGNSLRVGRNM
jgi:catechol 2,3-dioxygenase-like lactoylglutathione lyase family enzyme